jgi:hypothetical protein
MLTYRGQVEVPLGTQLDGQFGAFSPRHCRKENYFGQFWSFLKGCDDD